MKKMAMVRMGSVATDIRSCYACRGAAEGRRENYAYSECGLKNVVLQNVVVYRCQRCGSESVEIPNMDGLHRSLALGILCKRTLLSGDEMRFLRKVAGFTATELAKNMGVTKTAVSRWENGTKMSGPSDRLIRLICGFTIIDEIVNERSGPVNLEEVKQTIMNLQRFLVQFNPKSILPGIRAEVQESEKLLIDPECPLNFSVLPPFIHQPSPRVQ